MFSRRLVEKLGAFFVFNLHAVVYLMFRQARDYKNILNNRSIEWILSRCLRDVYELFAGYGKYYCFVSMNS